MLNNKVMFLFILSFNQILICQNIINTLGTSGTFYISDGAANFLTLSQTTGNVSLFRNMELGGIASSTSTSGVITKNGVRFMHNYGIGNTFLGENSGNFTMSGVDNIGIGSSSLINNTTGSSNTATGNFSLNFNTTGNKNSAYGRGSLSRNTTGFNNSAYGVYSLQSNTTGNENSAIGFSALYYNSTGASNTALGNYSLYYNISGNNNTALGVGALYDNYSGNNNIAIGYYASVPYSDGDNQVRIGNAFITYAGIEVAWTITSDRNLKKNILNSNLGLGFISKLRPVSYTRKNDESNKTEYGLIAQEVEEILKLEGVENSSMLAVTDNGEYQLRYNDLLAPMIKAIQELKAENDDLKNELNEMKDIKIKLNALVIQIEQLKHDYKEIKLTEK